jgi:hypothetical protein
MSDKRAESTGHGRLGWPQAQLRFRLVAELFPAIRGFARCVGVNGECMHPTAEFVRKRIVDHAVALKPALPNEGFGHDIDPEVGLPSRSVPGVADMLMGFIHDIEVSRAESLGQLLRDEIARRHFLGTKFSGRRAPVQGHEQQGSAANSVNELVKS